MSNAFVSSFTRSLDHLTAAERLEKEIEAKITGEPNAVSQVAEDSTNQRLDVFTEDFGGGDNSKDSFQKGALDGKQEYQDKHTDTVYEGQQEREGAIKPFSEQFPGSPDAKIFADDLPSKKKEDEPVTEKFNETQPKVEMSIERRVQKKLAAYNEEEVAKVMREFYNGTLHSADGAVVTDENQAKAIAISEGKRDR